MAGCLYAQANGFVNAGKQSVSLIANDSSTLPAGLTGNTPTYWIKTNVSETLPNMFSVFGLRTSSMVLNASSVASVAVTPPAGCIYVLSSNASPGLSMVGTSSVTSSCGVFINSGANPALDVKETASLNATSILINSGTYRTTGGAVISPTPNTNGGPVSDPLATLSEPSVSNTCDHINSASSGKFVGDGER